jgi:membrane-associated protein
VAGAGSMVYSTFIRNCILGAILWVTSITLVGYFLGNLEIVQKNFEFVVFGIVGISLLPILFEVVKKRFA